MRVIDGETTYFAHVDGLAEADLERAADAAAAAALAATTASRRHLPPRRRSCAQEIETDPGSVAAKRKAELLRACDERARSRGGDVAQVQASYAEARRRITVANSEGRLAIR